MIWERLLEFLAMGGFAVYVWGTYAVALAAALIEFALLVLRKRSILGHLGCRGSVLTATDEERLKQHHRSDRHGVVTSELP